MGGGSAMIRCSNCNHPNEEGAAFCANCHFFLAWEAEPGTGGKVDTEETPEPAREAEPEPAPQAPTHAPAAATATRPDGPRTGPASVRELIAALDASGALAGDRDRPDLAERLAGVRTMVEQRAVTVAVVGEFKRGKSTLVNALLQTAACPVDADIVTGVPTLVGYGGALRAIAHLQRPGELEETLQDVRIEDLAALVSERADDRPSDVRTVEVRVPHRMLRSGLCLLDTPGVGGLESVHGQLSLASLNGADGVLFVTDASQELTAPELGYLQTAVNRCPRAALVVTKTDLHQHWRRIVETNRRHLAQAGLDVPVLPVSSFLRLRAARQPALNEESGFAPLTEFLAGVLQQTLSRQAGTAAHEVDFVAAQLAHENDAERVVLAKPEERAAVVDRLDVVHQRARSLGAASAAWQQVLADGIQDLVADVEHDLAARLRTVLRDARDIIDESDPKDTWEETQNWLRRQVAEAGVANRDLLLRRANELSDSVAEQFSLESGSGVELELDSVTRALAALELPSASTFSMPGGRLSSVLSSGRLAAYVPLMALSVALHTTLLIIPPAALLGAVVGRKLFQMEGKRQKAYRQGQAKAAAGKFVDEVAFEMNKDTRDGLRRTQRRLRDEFQSRAGSIQASTSAALAAARRASDLPPGAQATRAAELDRETRELGQIREHMRTLAGAGAG
jgi:GTPase SAR1 family protein